MLESKVHTATTDFAILLLGFAVGGCAGKPASAPAIPTPAKSTIPDELTLYSIEGTVDFPAAFVTDDQNFRGYKILGKTKIGDPTLRPEIVKAIHDGIGESDGAVALSFCPRYGVRTVTDGVPVDYMICYECSQVYVFTRGIGPRIEPTTGKYQAVLADCLTSAGIELAPGIEEKLSNSD